MTGDTEHRERSRLEDVVVDASGLTDSEAIRAAIALVMMANYDAALAPKVGTGGAG